MAIGGEIRKSQEAAVARNKQRALRREKEMEKIPGSTSLITYCSKDRKLTIAVKGDSRAVLVCVKENNDVEMIRLTNDQRPDNPLEKFRIESEGAVVVNSRVNGNSAVARSDGDSWVEGRTGQKLISSEPEIYSYDVAKIAKAKNAKQVFLISSCDAFYENKANENKYKAPLKRWFNDRLLQARWGGNIAAYLKDFAVGICETHDNTTDIVADLSNDLKEAIVTELYDGHLGKEIAEFLVTNFGPRLGLEEGVHEISRKKEEVLMPEVELMRQNSGAVTVILKDGEDQDRKRPQQARHNRANPSFDFGSDFGVDSAYGEDKSSDSDGKSGDLDRDDEQPRVSVSLSAQSMPPASAPSRAAPASNSASAPARNPQNASAAPVRATGPCCVIL
jgi:serine/threonine protein phosphatase PrpC